MSIDVQCPRCGSRIAPGRAADKCPACLLEAAAGDGPDNDVEDDDDDSATDFDAQASAPPADGADDDSEHFRDVPRPLHPRQIGPYRLIEKIGEGGMGVVYKAEQRGPVRRIVALKLLKPGVDSREVIARFDAERQALALMNHEHVAKVFDAGMTDAGMPYFVMEYVAGESITAYCDHHKLNTRARLELFLQACEAVQHAHTKAIIHRDIKPSNVLVALEDDRPVVKVIDFGVAKALTQRLTDQTLFTEHGRLIGTPEYMSPEQAEMSRLDVDTRTDIYSLGVVLYELLTGALPFDPTTLRQAAYAELRRIIREQEPPKPSTRLGSLGADAERVARCHSADWTTLCRELRGELEWIPLKAMRKERAERYRSASEFADDIRNYLQCRPLIAGPQSAAYRTWKFVSKHSRAVALAASVLVVLAALVVALAQTTRKAIVAAASEHTLKLRSDSLKTDAEQKAQALRLAQAAQRDTTRTLAHSLIGAGDSLAALGQPADARERYVEAMEALDTLSEPTHGVVTRLLPVSDPAALPLAGAYARRGITGGFAGHVEKVNAVAVSDDGRTAITASEDGTLKLWDLLTGVVIRTFERQAGVALVAIAPGGKTALSANNDGMLILWDVQTGQIRESWAGGIQKVWAVAFSPDGRMIASGGEAEGWRSATDVQLWDLGSGHHKPAGTLRGHRGAVAGIAFSPRDGRTLLTASHDGTVRLWDVATGAEISTAGGFNPGYTDRVNRDNRVNCVAFSPDGGSAVSADFDGNLFLWDVASGTKTRSFDGHVDWVWRVAFSRDGSRLVSGSRDGTVRVWDVKSGREVRRFSPGEGDVMGVAFLAGGSGVVATRCAILDGDWPATQSALAVWATDPKEGAGAGSDVDPDRLAALEGGVPATHGLSDAVTAVAISDDRTVLLGTVGGELALWDALAKQVLVPLPRHVGPVRAAALSRDGCSALSVDGDGVAHVFDLASRKEVGHFTGPPGGLRSAALVAGAQRALAAGDDGVVRMYATRSAGPSDAGAQLTLVGDPDLQSTAWDVSPDGQSALTCQDGPLFQWDLRPAASAGPTRHTRKAGATLMAWSPDLHALLYTRSPTPPGAPPGLLCLADLSTGVRHQLVGHEARVTAVAISAQGAALSGDEAGNVILWDARDRSLLRSFPAHAGPVTRIAFSPDGQCAVSIGADKAGDSAVKLWDFRQVRESLVLEKRVRAAREALARNADDATALATMAEWYAFRGKDDWAAELFDRAGGAAPVSHLAMGRSFWRLGDAARAHAEFAKALEHKQASAFYMTLCTQATASQPATVPSAPAAERVSDASASARP